jgi:integrase
MGKDLKGKELGVGLGQRKDGRYEARAVVNGVKIAIYNFNLSELKREFEREKEKAKRSNVVHCPDVTVMEWFDAWFEQYKKPTLKPTGVATYKRKFVNTYGKQLGFVKVKELNQFIIQTATTELVNQGYKFKSIRDALSVLKLMLDAAVGNCIIDYNPALGIIVPTYAETKEERRVLTKQEQKTFLDKIESSFYKELYHFMLLTGVRVGEMGALQWSDIDFENEFININHSLTCHYVKGKKTLMITTPKTKNSFRKIPFFGETKQILLAQKEKQKELKKQLGDRRRGSEELENADLVFTTSMGSPVTRYVLEHDMRQVSKDINAIELYNATREGRETVAFDHLHPHALRHTFATRCFEKGMGVETVQKIMGHANINMTMSYTHVLDDVLKQAASNVGNFSDA